MLLRKYDRYVYTVIANTLGARGTHEDTEELTQDTFTPFGATRTGSRGSLKAIWAPPPVIRPCLGCGGSPRRCCPWCQTSKQETMMVVTEGRMTSSPGCSVDVVAKKIAEYDCYQALNLDGGTSAIMYYDGEPVTICCDEDLPNGRTMPNAWVYRSAK